MAIRNYRGDSTVQRQAEGLIRAGLEKKIGLKKGGLSESKIDESLGSIKLDGFCKRKRPICVEIWAHQGKAKSAQMSKVMKDMCKLLLAEKKLKKRCRKIFAVSDKQATAHLENSWQGEFAKAFGIEILSVKLNKSTIDKIRHAQKRQYR